MSTSAIRSTRLSKAIPDGEILEGSIPGSKLKLALAWMEIHRDELIADWDLAAIGQQPYKIEPLK